MANLGDLPGSMYIADTRENFKRVIYQHTPNVTAEEVEALADLYEYEGKYPVIAVAIYIKARSEFGVFQKEAYSNKAWLVKDGETPISANAIMQIEDSNAGIEVVAPLNATLTKTDYHTGAAIAGARFKLEVLNGSVWSQYIPNSGAAIRTTDSSGRVTFENLPDGTYRFVEVEAAATYDPSSVIYSKGQFTITSSD